MGEKKRIVIFDDHQILREGLKALLSPDPELEIAGEAEDGPGAIRIVEKVRPDLALIDLAMPGMSGAEVISKIKIRSPETRILVLTVHNTDEYIVTALQAGADGYILKDSTSAELKTAIKKVLDGKFFLSPGISVKLGKGCQDGRIPLNVSVPWDTLSNRQKEVLELIAVGYKNKAIARILGVSVKTVETHRGNLMRKLDLHSVSALTALAAKRGLISK